MFNFPSNAGLPGFRVGRPDDPPGFRMNQDGSVGRFAGAPSTAPDDNALQTTGLLTGFGSAATVASEPSGVIPVNCTSPDMPQYHSYSVPSVLRGAPGPQLMQGVVDNPTPSPRMLNHPATPQGL